MWNSSTPAPRKAHEILGIVETRPPALVGVEVLDDLVDLRAHVRKIGLQRGECIVARGGPRARLPRLGIDLGNPQDIDDRLPLGRQAQCPHQARTVEAQGERCLVPLLKVDLRISDCGFQTGNRFWLGARRLRVLSACRAASCVSKRLAAR